MPPPIVRSNRRISTRIAILLLCAQFTLCFALGVAVMSQPTMIDYRYGIGHMRITRAFGGWTVVLLSLFPIALLVHKVRPIRYIGPLLIVIVALQCLGMGLAMDAGGSSLNPWVIEDRLGRYWHMRLDRTILPYYLAVSASFLFWTPLPKTGRYRRFLFETLPARFQLSDSFAAIAVVALICSLFRFLWDVN